MKRTQGTQVMTKDGRRFFGTSDSDLTLALYQAGNPEVVAVRLPSGTWSTSLAKFYNN